jgi:hypothetical protein
MRLLLLLLLFGSAPSSLLENFSARFPRRWDLDLPQDRPYRLQPPRSLCGGAVRMKRAHHL